MYGCHMTTKRTARPASPATVMVEVVVVTCGCGFLPLDKAMHRTAQAAWQAAADHVSLNPTKCRPNMSRDLVPAVFA